MSTQTLYSFAINSILLDLFLFTIVVCIRNIMIIFAHGWRRTRLKKGMFFVIPRVSCAVLDQLWIDPHKQSQYSTRRKRRCSLNLTSFTFEASLLPVRHTLGDALERNADAQIHKAERDLAARMSILLSSLTLLQLNIQSTPLLCTLILSYLSKTYPYTHVHDLDRLGFGLCSGVSCRHSCHLALSASSRDWSRSKSKARLERSMYTCSATRLIMAF